MEEWRPIPGYEGIYEASNLGNLRSVENKTTYSKRHGLRHWKQRILRQKVTGNRYARKDARIILWKDGMPRTYLVARIIAMTWCDGFRDNMTVNHIDGNPLNNSCDNLEWVSLKANIQHGYKTGLYRTVCKPVTLVSISDNSFQTFDSMANASRWLGKRSKYVSDCITKERNAYGADGQEYLIIK